MQVVAAPMGFLTLTHRFVPDWMPSGEGMQENRRVLREMLARLAGG
jgi:exopolyphosphatase/pppGpp-phosphohydrolase